MDIMETARMEEIGDELVDVRANIKFTVDRHLDATGFIAEEVRLEAEVEKIMGLVAEAFNLSTFIYEGGRYTFD